MLLFRAVAAPTRPRLAPPGRSRATGRWAAPARGSCRTSSMAPSAVEGSLWSAIDYRYQSAAEKGAAFKTDTETVLVEEGGVGFIVRVATALAAKDKAKKAGNDQGGTKSRNPFLPPEEDLFVGNLSETHCLVLNKFNVVPHHTLVVTRTFQPQTDPLNSQDLDAVWEVLRSMPGEGGLAFYDSYPRLMPGSLRTPPAAQNCGEHSGRSQPHKHVQLVPLPMEGGSAAPWPFADVLAPGSHPFGMPFSAPSLPYAHHAVSLCGGITVDGAVLEGLFTRLLSMCEADVEGIYDGPVSYNMILTSEVMLLVPRGAESVGPVAANALGFAGTLLVRTAEELEHIKSEGPMTILGGLGVPPRAAVSSN